MSENPLGMGLGGEPAAFFAPITPQRAGAANLLELMRGTAVPASVIAEVDATRLQALYEASKPHFERAYGMSLGYTPFFARATVKALMANPLMNAALTPRGYVIPRYIHLGVAMQGPQNVLLPTIYHAETKGVEQLAFELNQAAQRVALGQVTAKEMADSTFVITNTGSYGQSLFGIPTIKAGNTGVLAFEAIRKRPVVTEGDKVEARPSMHIVLSADHRAVDGIHMNAFIGKVKEILETVNF